MRKEVIAVLGLTVLLVSTMVVLAIVFDLGGKILGLISLSIFSLIVVFLYQRFRRSAPEVPPACHLAAAVALMVGASALVGGVGHSVDVALLTLREPEYGPLQILRLTTGALLIFSGAMTLAMCPGIRVGRRWPMGVGAATGLLFWLYMLFTIPLPGAGGTATAMVGLWSVYLLSLGAAAARLSMGKSNVGVAS